MFSTVLKFSAAKSINIYDTPTFAINLREVDFYVYLNERLDLPVTVLVRLELSNLSQIAGRYTSCLRTVKAIKP